MRLYHGDCLDVMAGLPDCSVDAVVTDPPYGLAEHRRTTIEKALLAWLSGDREHVPDGRGFMGREWDRFVPPPAVWDECFRVLKPGGYLLAFAGSRTVDLMGISIRLGGLTTDTSPGIRDSIAWLYGQGFPKNKKTALKPAFEPIIVARKSVIGTVAANVQQHGTGQLNIEACRTGVGSDKEPAPKRRGNSASWFTTNDAAVLGGDDIRGRWPTNVALDESQAERLDAQSGITRNHARKDGRVGTGGASGIYNPNRGKLPGQGTDESATEVRGRHRSPHG